MTDYWMTQRKEGNRSMLMKLKLVYVKLREIVEKFHREEIEGDLTIEWGLMFT